MAAPRARLASALGALGLVLCACGPAPASDAGPQDAGADAGPGDAGAPDAGELRADAGETVYAEVGESVAFDGTGSRGAVRYEWNLGGGVRLEGAQPVHTFTEAGRFTAVLSVFDAADRRRSDSVQVRVSEPLVHAPAQSSSVAVWAARQEVAVVSPDSAELAVFEAEPPFALVRRVATAPDPRTVTVFDGRWAVVCQGGGRLELHPPDGGAPELVEMPRASRPFGAVAVGDALWVSLQASGELARVAGSPASLVERVPSIADGRDVARLPDGRVAVSRWRSPDREARIALVGDGAPEVVTLAFDPQAGSDTESGGVPGYLGPLLVAATGRFGVVPSLQAALDEGLFVGPRPLTHETTLRAAVSFVDLGGEAAEDFARRKLYDDRGFASAGALTSRGDVLFVAMRGSRTVERLDLLTGADAGSILDVGLSPQGLALSPDDRFLFVDAYLSRQLVVYDVSDLGANPSELARLPITSAEPLEPELLLGKILFNDSADPRLTMDSYIACAHCHLEGQADRLVWDFTDRGEGLRNTIDLLGRGGVDHGPLHWSANFDEVQDFEHDIRGPFAGTGLLSDADFLEGTRSQPLGDAKGGLSPALDALAAYVTSLDRPLESPAREDGALSPAASRGALVFESAGCASCHAAPRFTDSALVDGAPLLHDVGTLGPGSGMRLGGLLAGIDTPTLLGLWQSAPYLHDGSAATLREVLVDRNAADTHGVTSGLSPGELDDLIAYLSEL